MGCDTMLFMKVSRTPAVRPISVALPVLPPSSVSPVAATTSLPAVGAGQGGLWIAAQLSQHAVQQELFAVPQKGPGRAQKAVEQYRRSGLDPRLEPRNLGQA